MFVKNEDGIFMEEDKVILLDLKRKKYMILEG
jgi:hypothetical protein